MKKLFFVCFLVGMNYFIFSMLQSIKKDVNLMSLNNAMAQTENGGGTWDCTAVFQMDIFFVCEDGSYSGFDTWNRYCYPSSGGIYAYNATCKIESGIECGHGVIISNTCY